MLFTVPLTLKEGEQAEYVHQVGKSVTFLEFCHLDLMTSSCPYD